MQEIPQAFQHGGLAGAYLARQDHEALAALHAINQVGQSFLVLRATEQERRVRAHVEGIFGETEEGFIHGHYARTGGLRYYRILTCSRPPATR